MRVCVIGTESVGLATAACLAHIGHNVVCVDNNEFKVALMQLGKSPISEPGLARVMRSAIAAHRLEFTTDLAAGVDFAQVLFIAVETPALPTGEKDTYYLEEVAQNIGSHLRNDYKVIVNKSAVSKVSADWLRRLILNGVAQNQAKIAGFNVVSNPEFLRSGSAVYDTFHPERIIFGSDSSRAIAIMQKLYQPIIKREFIKDKSLPAVPVVTTDLESAEKIIIKHTANSFLNAEENKPDATKINKIADICTVNRINERVGADMTNAAQGIQFRFSY